MSRKNAQTINLDKKILDLTVLIFFIAQIGGLMKRYFFLLIVLIVSNIFAETLTIQTHDESYNFDLSEIANITFSENVAIEDLTDIVNKIPVKYLKNYPNPFNPRTTISFELNDRGRTKLENYNLKGQKVKELVNKILESGRHEYVWNGINDSNKKVASGVYFYSLTHENKSIVKKMIVLK